MDELTDILVQRCIPDCPLQTTSYLTAKLRNLTTVALCELQKRLSYVAQRLLSQQLETDSGEDVTDDTGYWMSQIFGVKILNRSISESGDMKMEDILRKCHRDLISTLQLQNSAFLERILNHPSKVMDQMEADSINGKSTTRAQNEEFIRWTSGKLSVEQFEQNIIPLLDEYQPDAAAILKTAITNHMNKQTAPSPCPVCRVKETVQPKKLAGYLYEKKIIPPNLYEDLRNTSSTNHEKWSQLQGKLSDSDVPELINALEKSYPMLQKEILEKQMRSLKCLCGERSLRERRRVKTEINLSTARHVAKPTGPQDSNRIASALHTCMGDLAPYFDLRGTTVLDALVVERVVDDQEVESLTQKPTPRQRYEDFVRIVSARCSVDKFKDKMIPHIGKHYPDVGRKLAGLLEIGPPESPHNKCTLCKLRDTVELKRVCQHLIDKGAISPTVYDDLLNQFATNETKWQQLQGYMKDTHLQDLVDALERPYPELYKELKDKHIDTFACDCGPQVLDEFNSHSLSKSKVATGYLDDLTPSPKLYY